MLSKKISLSAKSVQKFFHKKENFVLQMLMTGEGCRKEPNVLLLLVLIQLNQITKQW